MAAPVRHLTIAGIALALAGPTSVHTSRFRGMYAVARLDRNDQFNELLPFAAIDVEPCECSASTDPEPLPDKLRFAVDGDGVIAAGAEAWFAALREGAAAVLREGAAAVLRAGAAAVPVFVGDLVCGSAFRLAKDDDP